MELWSENFLLDALLYLNFFQNFLMKIVEDIKKKGILLMLQVFYIGS